MSIEMIGTDVAKVMKDTLIQRVQALKEKGIQPSLSIIRVGERPDDLAYERAAKKRMELTQIACRVIELPEDIGQEAFEEECRKVNEDSQVHGILLFRPLPKHLKEEPIKAMIHPYKDVDCMCATNIAKVFSGDERGFAPCTSEAVVKMLEHYAIDVAGKRVTIVGRSMVVGRPLAMLMLQKNATVTICHTGTSDLQQACCDSEILIAAAGKAKMITDEMVAQGAVVADVGMNVDEKGNICGDVDYEAVVEKTSYISPVPRGVGSVTTSILAEHVVRATEYLNGIVG